MAFDLLVVVGKGPLTPHSDASLLKPLPMAQDLVPGTRLEPIEVIDDGVALTGAVEVHLALKPPERAKLESDDWRARDFWVAAERLKLIPAKPTTLCSSCNKLQPLKNFSRAARVKMKEGLHARCLSCSTAQDSYDSRPCNLGSWHISIATGAILAGSFVGAAALSCRQHEQCSRILHSIKTSIGRGSSSSSSSTRPAAAPASAASFGESFLPSALVTLLSAPSFSSSSSSSSSSVSIATTIAGGFAVASVGLGVAMLVLPSALARLREAPLFEVPERDRRDVPLPLVGEMSDLPWETLVADTFHRSFSSLLRCPFSADELKAWYSTVHEETPWERPETRGGTLLPRKAAWFVGRGCRCSYEYNGTRWAAHPMPDWLLELEEAVWSKFGTCGDGKTGFPRPNSCVLNLYSDGSEAVDWHADNEDLFDGLEQDCRIVSLSLGSSRAFEMKKKRRSMKPGIEPPSVRVDLIAGDIVTMEGRFQRHWSHRVPKQLDIREPRINLTWRHITRHDESCPLHQK